MTFPAGEGSPGRASVEPSRRRPWATPRVILSEIQRSEFNNLTFNSDHPLPSYTSTGSATPS
jgi:hypothetical protein